MKYELELQHNTSKLQLPQRENTSYSGGEDKNNTTYVWTRGRWQHTQNKHQCHIVWKQKQKATKYHRSICSCSLLFCGGIMTERCTIMAVCKAVDGNTQENICNTFSTCHWELCQELLVHFDKLTWVGVAFLLLLYSTCTPAPYQPGLPANQLLSSYLLLHLLLFTRGLNGTLIIITGNTRVTTANSWQYGFS